MSALQTYIKLSLVFSKIFLKWGFYMQRPAEIGHWSKGITLEFTLIRHYKALSIFHIRLEKLWKRPKGNKDKLLFRVCSNDVNLPFVRSSFQLQPSVSGLHCKMTEVSAKERVWTDEVDYRWLLLCPSELENTPDKPSNLLYEKTEKLNIKLKWQIKIRIRWSN